MKVYLVPSSTNQQGDGQHYFATSFVVDDTVVIDAGCIGFHGTPEEQRKLKHLVLSHTHFDHVASLPIFVENAYTASKDCVTIYGSEPVLQAVRADIFNGRAWPDFVALSNNQPGAPFLRLVELKAETPVQVGRLKITPVPVNHVVPTFGFLIEDGTSTVVMASDTGPTERIWELVNSHTDLKAVFLEASFPEHMRRLADVSKHLTPTLFGSEIRKLARQAPCLAVHIKAPFRQTVAAELMALGDPRVQIAEYGKAYYF